jgi:hypothetical protein
VGVKVRRARHGGKVPQWTTTRGTIVWGVTLVNAAY